MTERRIPEPTINYTGRAHLLVSRVRAVVAAAHAFTTEDDSRPMLTCVWLMVRGRRLYAIGLNPYSFGLANTEHDGDSEFDAPVPRAVVKDFLRDTRSHKAAAEAEFVFTEDGKGSLTYGLGDYTIERRWPTLALTMPNFRQVMPKDPPVATPAIQLNPRFLADIPVSGVGARLVFHGPLAPVEVDADDFYAVIMPLRVPLE